MSFSKPIFVRSDDCPEDVCTYSICTACELLVGPKGMIGAQPMGDEWRLYPAHDKGRATLLAAGISLQGKSVPLYSQSPFTLTDSEGNKIESTKLSINGVAISYSNE